MLLLLFILSSVVSLVHTDSVQSQSGFDAHIVFHTKLRLVDNLAGHDRSNFSCLKGCKVNLRVCISVIQNADKLNVDIVRFDTHCLGNGARSWDMGIQDLKSTFHGYSIKFGDVIKSNTDPNRAIANPLVFDNDIVDRKSSYLIFAELDHLKPAIPIHSDHPFMVIFDKKKLNYTRYHVDRFVKIIDLADVEPYAEPKRHRVEGTRKLLYHHGKDVNSIFVFETWSSCATFYYGCMCNIGCVANRHYECEKETGVKLCNYGFYGEQCSEECYETKTEGGECLSNGVFSCKDGFMIRNDKKYSCQRKGCMNYGNDFCNKIKSTCKSSNVYKLEFDGFFTCVKH